MRLARRSRVNVKRSGLLFLLAAIWMCPTLSHADEQYHISWHSIDNGGGRSSGGQYVLVGAIGQADAAYSSGGRYELLGGFLPGGPMCMVEFGDFARLAEQWLQTGGDLAGDIDQDHDVDIDDLRWLADFWLCHCPVPWSLK